MLLEVSEDASLKYDVYALSNHTATVDSQGLVILTPQSMFDEGLKFVLGDRDDKFLQSSVVS